MDNGQFKQMLERLLQADFSAGTEPFREELLARCLAVLNADSEGGVAELDEADLELLAAAGVSELAEGLAAFERRSRPDA